MKASLLFSSFVLVALTACSNKGSLTIEPGLVKTVSQGSPYMRMNVGGKAMVWDLGQTQANSDVHGWVSLQSVSSKGLNDGSNTELILNKTQELSK